MVKIFCKGNYHIPYPRIQNAGVLLKFRIFSMCTMVIFDQYLSKINLNLDKKLLKMTTVCPNCAPWRSNQEWRSICTDRVCHNIVLKTHKNVNTYLHSFQVKGPRPPWEYLAFKPVKNPVITKVEGLFNSEFSNLTQFPKIDLKHFKSLNGVHSLFFIRNGVNFRQLGGFVS